MDLVSILRLVAISAVPLLIAITFHEVAHGLAAYRMGDGTAKAMGRLTLNPLPHIDPIGTVLMPLMLYIFTNGTFVFGYAKPVPINPYNFRNPRKGMALSAAAGPAMNIALAVVSTILFGIMLNLQGIVPHAVFEPVTHMLDRSIFINVFLAAINLLPVPPLDGGRIVTGFLPARQAAVFARLEPYGMIIAILLLVTRLYLVFVIPIVNLITYFLKLLLRLF